MRKQTVVIGALFSLLVSRPVLAEPWFGWGDGRQEDRYEDGDLDFEDLLVTRMGPKVGRSGGHARSWFSVGGVVRTAWTGERDVSVVAVVGLALDRIASPRVVPPLPPGAPTPSPEVSLQRTYVTEMPRLALSPAVIRACVDAALRAAGLGSDDARLDSMAERARLGALLPEVRLRVARSFDETARSNAAASAETRYYDATGANLWLEGRLTWRLDRVLYADDEPSFERIRQERREARAKLSAKTLHAIFAWQRARLDYETTPDGTRERIESALRLLEAEAALDVLTGSWFTLWRSQHVR